MTSTVTMSYVTRSYNSRETGHLVAASEYYNTWHTSIHPCFWRALGCIITYSILYYAPCSVNYLMTYPFFGEKGFNLNNKARSIRSFGSIPFCHSVGTVCEDDKGILIIYLLAFTLGIMIMKQMCIHFKYICD